MLKTTHFLFSKGYGSYAIFTIQTFTNYSTHGKKQYFNFILSFVLIINVNIGLSQNTGPGGVGTTNGESNLEIWLDANQRAFTDGGSTLASNGQAIQQWHDLSGNTNHAIQTDQAFQPIYLMNSHNGLATLSFSLDELLINYDISPSIQPNITVISVAKHNTASNTKSKIFGHDDGNFDRSIGYDDRCTGGNIFQYFGNNGVNCILSPRANTPFITTAVYTDNTFSFWYNGNQTIQNIANTNGDGEPILNIGGITNRGGARDYIEFWDGDITEFILFNTTINTAQHIIIQNYLSAKYDIPLTANDVYIQDESINGNYDYDVAGIGQAFDGTNHTDAQGSGIVRISNPSDLDDNEFLIWGHNNEALNSTGITDVPAEVQVRLAREWRSSEVGEVGTVTISFDLSDVPGSITQTDLSLLIDTDNDGLFNDESTANGGVISGAINTSGNLYQWSGVKLKNNLRFTIGSTNSTQTPLPIDLILFDAIVTPTHEVELNWSTASETGNDFFTVEHSQNAIEWKKLAVINGAGFSQSLLHYNYHDQYPIEGMSYYRLKQTDFDGTFTYSKVKSVQIDKTPKSNFITSSNPINNIVTIYGDHPALDQVQVYNNIGQNISHLTHMRITKNNELQISFTSIIPNGIYFIRTLSKVYRIVKL